MIWFKFSESFVGFYCDPAYASSECPGVSMNAYSDEICESDDYFELRLITNECIYSQWNKWERLECTEDTATMNTYQTITPQCSDQYLINSTLITQGSLEGEDAGCILIEGCENPTPSPTTNPLMEQYANRDIGCNYINWGGVAMPIDYCMQTIFQGLDFGMKFVCNATWDGVDLEIYDNVDCNGASFSSNHTGMIYNNVCEIISK